MHARAGPPIRLGRHINLISRDSKIPIRIQRDGRGKGHDQHENRGQDDNHHQHLPGATRPLEGKQAGVERQDGHFGKEEGEDVTEDAVPCCLFIPS